MQTEAEKKRLHEDDGSRKQKSLEKLFFFIWNISFFPEKKRRLILEQPEQKRETRQCKQ